MWPLLLLSLTLFGTNQIMNSRNSIADGEHKHAGMPSTTTQTAILKVEGKALPSPSGPISRLPSSATTIKTPTTTKEPNYYLYFDEVTKKEYQIPKLGSCKAIDGYRFMAGPDKEGFSVSQGGEGPQPFSMKYGFTWKDAPEDDELLERINKTKIADNIRVELQIKAELLFNTTRLADFYWYAMPDPNDNNLHGIKHYPVKTSRNRDNEIYPKDEFRLYAFQVMFICGVYKVYTPLFVWMECDEVTGEFHIGEQVFRNGTVCLDVFKQIHKCEYVFEWE